MIMEIIVWEVHTPVAGSNHHYKYRLFYGNTKHGRIIGYDNERPKGDHRHYGEREETYTLSTIDQLLDDFFSDIDKHRRQA